VRTAARRAFFDIPIYRVSKDEYAAEFDQYMNKLDNKEGPEAAALRKKLDQEDPESAEQRRDIFRDSFGGAWQFNEIIGYIRLDFLGSQVRGKLWMANVKRVVKTRKRQLVQRSSEVVPVDIPRNATNDDVFRTIVRYLEAAKAKLRPYYVDTLIFDRIGPYVDWNRLRST
jgi:hypothetical protein